MVMSTIVAVVAVVVATAVLVVMHPFVVPSVAHRLVLTPMTSSLITVCPMTRLVTCSLTSSLTLTMSHTKAMRLRSVTQFPLRSLLLS